MNRDGDATGLDRLAALVRRLRGPDGCPWDREQGLGDLRPYLLEEAHEAAAAIDAGDWDELAAELGDLLFQVVFIAVLAEEAGAFEPGDVVERVAAKMVARHPHVFGDERAADAEAVRQAWERRKLAQGPHDRSLLEGVPASLPSLVASYRLTQKAAGVGFDWPHAGAVLTKLDEELAELRHELARIEAPARRPEVEHEIGDLLFTIANLARHLELDPEAALARANERFRRRFQAIERRLRDEGRSLAGTSLAEMDALWDEAKKDE